MLFGYPATGQRSWQIAHYAKWGPTPAQTRTRTRTDETWRGHSLSATGAQAHL